MMDSWLAQVAQWEKEGVECVIVTVVTAAGSAPQKGGARMLVSANQIWGTVGGGQLEATAIDQARSLMADPEGDSWQVRALPLAAKTGQCCGGRVVLTFECVRPRRIRIAVFGAGHVGQALAQVLLPLPWQVTWYDGRQEWLDRLPMNGRFETVRLDDPTEAAEALPAGVTALVMTHSHALDFDLCAALLARGDVPWVGLIGSKGKRERFVHRLRRRQIPTDRLHCPIGHKGGERLPAEIAVKIAAALVDQANPPRQSDARQEAAILRLIDAAGK